MIARYNNGGARTGSQGLALTQVVHGCLTITAKAYVLVAKSPLMHSMYYRTSGRQATPTVAWMAPHLRIGLYFEVQCMHFLDFNFTVELSKHFQ